MDKGRNKKIEYGDRIFARLTMGRRTVVEFMINRVADMTELIGELRHLTYGMRGLATVYIRNQSRGWSLERPLMLYSNSASGMLKSAASNYEVAEPAPRRMLFPWETH